MASEFYTSPDGWIYETYIEGESESDDCEYEYDVVDDFSAVADDASFTAAEAKRKVVLATNIAQTSLTIEGIDVVVDAGTERVNTLNVKTGSEQLITQPISIASAVQRMGRAGRLKPGVCYRLGSKEVFERRRKHDTAEIERVDLSQLLLEVSLWGAKFEDLFWLSEPEPALIKMAEQSLEQLGYWHRTSTGVKHSELVNSFQQYGLGLRYSKMLSFAKQDGAKELISTAALLACFLEQRQVQASANLAEQLEYISAKDWQKLASEFNRIGQRVGIKSLQRSDINVDLLGKLLLWAYPDRIAKKQGKRWKMANGFSVEFHSSQVEPKAEFIIVAGINSSEYGHFIQSYTEVEFTQIEELETQLIQESEVTLWSEQKQAPQRVLQTQIGSLVIAEKVLPLELTEQDWQNVWCSAIAQKGLSVLEQDDVITSTLNKFALARDNSRSQDFPHLDKPALLSQLQTEDNWLAPYLGTIRKLADLKKLNIADILLSTLSWEQQQELAQLCPEHYQTPAGNKRKINYLTEQPKLSVKLQEMFGEPASPAICDNKVAITLELLSPAQRPLQVTQDLANFWNNAYVEVKKEMKGRYPKHPWPDDPVNFVATTKTKRQLNK